MKLIRQGLTRLKEYRGENSKTFNRLIFLLKAALSITAIIFVLKRVAPGDVIDVFRSSRELYLIAALLLFLASKYISALRTLIILRRYDIRISEWENLKLYWAGMFYNLFLPGGIGGDVYKTFVINRLHKNGIKISAGSVLMDRIAGVTALMVLALLCIPFTSLNENYLWITISGVPVILISFIAMLKLFLPELYSISPKLIFSSFLVQLLQMAAVLMILAAFGIGANQIEYQLIFLISSIAAMLPVSVGGIGIRELVFLKISAYMLLDQQIAVSVSLTFYFITAFSSLFGIIPALESRKQIESIPETLIKT